MNQLELIEIKPYSEILENLFLEKGLENCREKAYLMYTCDYGTITISRHPLDKIQTKTDEILFGYAIIVRSPETGKIVKSYSINTIFDNEEKELKELTRTNNNESPFSLDQILNAHAPNARITTNEHTITNFISSVASRQPSNNENEDHSISPLRLLCQTVTSIRNGVTQVVQTH